MFVRRSDSDTGGSATLVIRTVTFAVGAGLALAGMALELGWLVNVAIAVLLVAFALRFLERDEGPEISE